MRFFALLGVVVILLLVGAVTAQPAIEMSDDEVLILNAINRSRIRDNLVHLVPNLILNQIAETYVNDLASRPINDLGEVFLTSNNANINDLLTQFGYLPYSNGYVVDFIPIVIRDFAPSQIIDTWINDFAKPEAERTLLSRRMIREGERLLPFFSPLYREIGIATVFNESTGRYYYTIIFAAQPNVLPIVITERTMINQIAQTVLTQDVLLYIHDERGYRNGDAEAIGAVRTMRISEQPGEQACPTNVAATDLTGGWQRYTNEVRWSLSAGAGSKTIYVQLCDNRGRTITASTQVSYLDEAAAGTALPFNGTATPDVMGIANATQTAAASATSYAPYLATVEAILTSTAAAP
jgi:hypothetical protein